MSHRGTIFLYWYWVQYFALEWNHCWKRRRKTIQPVSIFSRWEWFCSPSRYFSRLWCCHTLSGRTSRLLKHGKKNLCNKPGQQEVEKTRLNVLSTNLSNNSPIITAINQSINRPKRPTTESNGAGQKPHQKDHNERVAKVDERTVRSTDVQFGEVEVDAIDEQITGRHSTGDEWTPPPAIVFGAQVEVGQEHRRLRARYCEDNEHQEEKAEHIIRLMSPGGRNMKKHSWADSFPPINKAFDQPNSKNTNQTINQSINGSITR